MVRDILNHTLKNENLGRGPAPSCDSTLKVYSHFSTEAVYILVRYYFSLIEASTELVELLQERHNLQEEVDIRSITIEQLLKLAERRQLQLGEPLAVQMSVVRNSRPEGTESGLS